MKIGITPYTPYNCFSKVPDGKYMTQCVIDHSVYNPIGGFEEKDIPTVIETLKALLQYFKGEHTISVNKLIHVEPFEFTPQYRNGRPPEIRDWKVINDDVLSVTFTVTEPKVAKIIAENGKGSYGSKGWFLYTNFEVDDIKRYEWGCVCPSFKSAKEHVEWKLKHNEDIAHWEFVDIRKARKIKCNACGKQILNTEAQQCSGCGRYFCEDCLTEDTCSDCDN